MLQERFISLLSERGWTQEFFAKKSGIPLNTVKNIATGRTKDPQLSTLEAAAHAFNISIDCLIGKCPHTPQEKALLRYYRESGKHGKDIILLIARYEAEVMKEQRDAPGKRPFPCLNPKGDLRRGVIVETCKTINEFTTIENVHIGVKMPNDDFAPMYCEGDIILFENRNPKDEEIAAIIYKGRVYIRRLIKENGKYCFRCIRDSGADIIINRMDEIHCIGTAFDIIRA